MPSPIEAAMRAADATITASFGEPVQLHPRRTVPKRGLVADPDRSDAIVIGVFTMTSDHQPIEGGRRGTELNGFTRMAVCEAQVWLSAEQSAVVGFRPGKDDAVSLPERSGVSYVIVRVDPTDVGDLVLHLVPESQQ